MTNTLFKRFIEDVDAYIARDPAHAAKGAEPVRIEPCHPHEADPDNQPADRARPKVNAAEAERTDDEPREDGVLGIVAHAPWHRRAGKPMSGRDGLYAQKG